MVIFWYIHSVKWFLEQIFAFNYDPKAIVLKNCESWLLKILGKQYLQMSDDSREAELALLRLTAA